MDFSGTRLGDRGPRWQHPVRLRLRNTGDVVDEYRFEPVGEVAPWAVVEPATLRLCPGTTGTVELTFAPPRTPDAPAGPNPYAVRITPTACGLFLALGLTFAMLWISYQPSVRTSATEKTVEVGAAMTPPPASTPPLSPASSPESSAPPETDGGTWRFGDGGDGTNLTLYDCSNDDDQEWMIIDPAEQE